MEKVKNFLVHAMDVCVRGRGVAALILSIDTRWRLSV